MKSLPIICATLLQLGSMAYADAPNNQTASNNTIVTRQNNETALPNEIPFKKALSLTSFLLVQAPQEDAEMAANLSAKISRYAVLESQAKAAVQTMREARKAYKDTVRNMVFKNEQDLLNVAQQILHDTDAVVSQNIDDLKRDLLIKFDENRAAVFGSNKYDSVLQKARAYQSQLAELKKHPLFETIEKVRGELKPLMNAYLHQHYTSVQKLQEDFKEACDSVNTYLDALKDQ